MKDVTDSTCGPMTKQVDASPRVGSCVRTHNHSFLPFFYFEDILNSTKLLLNHSSPLLPSIKLSSCQFKFVHFNGMQKAHLFLLHRQSPEFSIQRSFIHQQLVLASSWSYKSGPVIYAFTHGKTCQTICQSPLFLPPCTRELIQRLWSLAIPMLNLLI